MQLHLYRHLWGLEEPWDEELDAFHDFGYRGVEVALPFVSPADEYRDHFGQLGLSCLPMVFTSGRNVREHVVSFREQMEEAVRFNPPAVTCHDGRDAFSRSEASAFYKEALAIEADLGVPVAHETHRGRILFNPWITSSLMDEFDRLLLCCDFSHWVVVCERLIDDQIEIIRQCADRAIHIHARVGYNEGPQVADPADPLFAEELEAHERWWTLIWEAQRNRGDEFTTMTPEFGPPPYMQTEPFTGNPVADQQSVSDWQARRQRQRFAALGFE
jgi:sugar phosphate isomerase/epimerase